ncbi:MAG: succinate dehydrogenase cytochrome b subunit [Leptolyngbya sp. SIO4C1]|nr:succinate dehydrogenase cytochrome b subunit [Leptolyngbya sp. SIO4C1]
MTSDVAPAAIAAGRIAAFYRSPVGKKIITGVTGLALASFVLIHMLGNLVLLFSPAAYNQYGYVIERLGPLIWGIELVLLTAVVFHAVLGIQIFLGKLKARPVGYDQYHSAGAPSQQSLSSRSMIWTGLILAGFLVWHLSTFKFGTYYTVGSTVGGSDRRDLARLVFEKFHQPLYAFGYTGILVLLGLHLRHGLWSAWQSIGAMSQGLKPVAYSLALMFAVAIALGFMVLPLAIYFGLIGS